MFTTYLYVHLYVFITSFAFELLMQCAMINTADDINN